MTDVNPKTGLPLVDEEKAKKNAMIAYPASIFLQVVLQAIGLGIAYCVYTFGSTDKYD